MFQASNSQPTKHGNRSHERNPDEELSAVSFQLLNACSDNCNSLEKSTISTRDCWAPLALLLSLAPPSPVVSLLYLPSFTSGFSRVSSMRMTNCSMSSYIVPVSSILQHLHFWISSMISSMRMKKLMLAFALPVSGSPLEFHPRHEKLMLTYVTPVSSILKPQAIFGFLLRFHPWGWETDAFQCNCPFHRFSNPPTPPNHFSRISSIRMRNWCLPMW